MTGAELALGGLVAVMGGGNIWNWLSSRGKTKVDLIQLSQTIASETIKALDSRIEELEAKIDALTTHVEALETQIRSLGATPIPRPKK